VSGRTRKVLTPLAITTLATSVGVVGSEHLAFAGVCVTNPPADHTDIFVTNDLGSTPIVGSAISSDMVTYDRGNNARCLANEAQTWSAAHIFLGTHLSDHYEVGYLQGGDASGTSQQTVFDEYRLNGMNVFSQSYPILNDSQCSAYPAVGSVRSYKVVNFPVGQPSFTAYFDCHDGRGWRHVDTVDVAFHWHSGYTAGEVGMQRPPGYSTVSDKQQNLARADESGNWSAWISPQCAPSGWSNSPPGWGMFKDSATQYHVDSGGTTC